MMVHTWAATLLKTPELELDQSEAKKLSEAYDNFCQYHEVPVLTPKRMSEVTLIACVFALYGPRFGAWRLRKKMEATERKQTPRVTPIRQDAQAAHIPVM